jgi:hypothetical protein
VSGRTRFSVAIAGITFAGVMLGAHGAFAAGDRPAPGLYKVTTVIAGELPRVSEECLSAAEIAEAFTLRTSTGTCATSRNVAAAGRIDLAQTCTSGKLVRSGSIAGTYSTSGYQLRVLSRAPELPHPLDMRISTQRIGTCSTD